MGIQCTEYLRQMAKKILPGDAWQAEETHEISLPRVRWLVLEKIWCLELGSNRSKNIAKLNNWALLTCDCVNPKTSCRSVMNSQLRHPLKQWLLFAPLRLEPWWARKVQQDQGADLLQSQQNLNIRVKSALKRMWLLLCWFLRGRFFTSDVLWLLSGSIVEVQARSCARASPSKAPWGGEWTLKLPWRGGEWRGRKRWKKEVLALVVGLSQFLAWASKWCHVATTRSCTPSPWKCCAGEALPTRPELSQPTLGDQCWRSAWRRLWLGGPGGVVSGFNRGLWGLLLGRTCGLTGSRTSCSAFIGHRSLGMFVECYSLCWALKPCGGFWLSVCLCAGRSTKKTCFLFLRHPGWSKFIKVIEVLGFTWSLRGHRLGPIYDGRCGFVSHRGVLLELCSCCSGLVRKALAHGLFSSPRGVEESKGFKLQRRVFLLLTADTRDYDLWYEVIGRFFWIWKWLHFSSTMLSIHRTW